MTNRNLNTTIRTIEHYDSVYDVYLGHFTEDMDELTEDQRDELQGVDDYEDFGYTVINDDTLILDEGGSVVEVMSLQEFFSRTMDYLKEAV